VALKAIAWLSTNGSGDVHNATSNDARADSHADSRTHNGGKRGRRNRDDGIALATPDSSAGPLIGVGCKEPPEPLHQGWLGSTLAPLPAIRVRASGRCPDAALTLP
jgi:hypothetical protein